MSDFLTKEDGLKLIRLVNWLNSDANDQIDIDVKLDKVLRLVNGDLSHLYDGLLIGRRLIQCEANDGAEDRLLLTRETSAYKFLTRQIISYCGVDIETFDYPITPDTKGHAIGYSEGKFYVRACRYHNAPNGEVNKDFIKNKVDAESVCMAMNNSLAEDKQS